MIWFAFCFFCAIFLNTSLANYLGISTVTTIAFTPLMLLIGRAYFLQKIKFSAKKNKEALILLLLGILIIILKLFLDQNYFKYVLTLILFPVLVSIYLESVSILRLKILRGILITFYLVECFIAFYEKLTMSTLIFNPILENRSLYYIEENWSFRSSALLGHPLANAMAVSVIMAFFVVSKETALRKYFFIIIGFIALFCFNARGATMISGAFILPYFFHQQYKIQKQKYRGVMITMFLSGLSVFMYLIINSSLGGRLLKGDKLIDGSAQTRLDVFRFYTFLTDYDLWFGNQDSYLYLTDKLKAGGVENGVVVLILNFGLMFTPLLLFLLFKFQNEKLKRYPKKERWLILSVFYLIGLMNPNLATPTQWMIFVFAYYGFKGLNKKDRMFLKNSKFEL